MEAFVSLSIFCMPSVLEDFKAESLKGVSEHIKIG